MFDNVSDFYYVGGDIDKINLSYSLMPSRNGTTETGQPAQNILAGKDMAFLHECTSECRFAACIGTNQDFPVNFSIILDDSVCSNFDHGGRLESLALDDSSVINSLVYTTSQVGSWADYLSVAQIPGVAVQAIPVGDGVLRKSIILAAFDNQRYLRRFYTPNLSTVRNVFGLRVESSREYATAEVATTTNRFPNSGNDIYPAVISSDSDTDPITSADGEIVIFNMRERTSYNGVFNRYGYGASQEGFLLNRWNSLCSTLYANPQYDLYMLVRGINFSVGAKYRVVFHFSYHQEYFISGMDDQSKNISGRVNGYGYIVGDDVSTSTYQYVPRSNLFGWEITNEIRNHFKIITPASEGFMSATNCPLWGDFHKTIPTAATWQSQVTYRREYDERIVIKPVGFIVTLNNHTKWWQ